MTGLGNIMVTLKKWGTQQTDGGWSGRLIGLEFDLSSQQVVETWKWTSPEKVAQLKRYDKKTKKPEKVQEPKGNDKKTKKSEKPNQVNKPKPMQVKKNSDKTKQPKKPNQVKKNKTKQPKK